MDNKINKTRLSNLLSYEWIMILVVVLAGILLFEMLYTVLGVRVSTGQYFKVYYDVNFTASYDNSSKLNKMINDKKALSYDVLKTDYEILTGDTDVLGIRLSVQEGDIIITDSTKPAESAANKSVRSEHIVDAYSMYTMDGLLEDAKKYINGFMTDGELDEEKISSHFLERMKKDNRFRSEEQKQEGKKLEKQRIERLVADVKDFEYFLANASEDCFYKYTKYTASVKNSEGETKSDYEKALQKEKDEGRENAVYGINLGALKAGEGETSAAEYFKVNGADSAKDSVVMAFNFLSYQPDLQFETITFITAVLRQCSNVI